MAFEPGPGEKTAGVLAELFESEFGKLLIYAGGLLLLGGVVFDEVSLFILSGLLFLIFAGVKSLAGEPRKKRHDHLMTALTLLPQPNAPQDVMWIEYQHWAETHPELVKQTVTPAEAKAICREKGWPESMLEPFVVDR